MSAPASYHAFTAYGIELEYMTVDRRSLAVRPLGEDLLCGPEPLRTAGTIASSHELVQHLVELKNSPPTADLEPLAGHFQNAITAINRRLDPLQARLMPTAMHPWMNPRLETQLWTHDDAAIYRAYDRIFDCHRHGWANLQSMHLNLPFADDAEFARLHAAVRLLLPILPALAASSPLADGRPTGFLDFRMACYREHQSIVPASIGRVIPDTVHSVEDYQQRILAPMYRQVAPLDPEGLLQEEWLNAHGAIPRFSRDAIEIRVIDLQECPRADLAIAAALIALAKELYDGVATPLGAQQAVSTDALVRLLDACIRDGEQAVIDDAAYLAVLGSNRPRCTAGALWQELVDGLQRQGLLPPCWREPLRRILDEGPLARRILRALGPCCERQRLASVYRELCDCLAAGRMFSPRTGGQGAQPAGQP